MKLITILFLFFAFQSVFSQNITLLNDGTIINSGDTITRVANSLNASLSIDRVKIVNSSTNNYTAFNCKKVELFLVSGSDVSYCWAGSCFPPNIFVSPNYVSFSPNDTISNFSAHFYSNSYSGTSYVNFVFFDSTITSDSVYFTAKFVVPLDASIDYGSMADCKIFPNPVVDKLNICLNVRIESIDIYSVDGKHILSKCNINSDKIVLSTGELKKGQYLIQIRSPLRVYNRYFIKY